MYSPFENKDLYIHSNIGNTKWVTRSNAIIYTSTFNKKILFIYLIERVQARGAADGEEEAGSPLSREPNTELNPRTLGSWPELKADA